MINYSSFEFLRVGLWKITVEYGWIPERWGLIFEFRQETP